jgi:hypothetical protein
MYVAVIRKMAGGCGVKTAKSLNTPLFFPDTCALNLNTYLNHWPKHLTTCAPAAYTKTKHLLAKGHPSHECR